MCVSVTGLLASCEVTDEEHKSRTLIQAFEATGEDLVDVLVDNLNGVLFQDPWPVPSEDLVESKGKGNFLQATTVT